MFEEYKALRKKATVMSGKKPGEIPDEIYAEVLFTTALRNDFHFYLSVTTPIEKKEGRDDPER